jgi:uncharacterized protein (DUF2147 family)
VPVGLVGTWKQPNGDLARVYDCGGKLCAKVIKGEREGLEMFNGMTPAGANRWQGGHMKHPGMPSFFTFNGTVTVEGKEMKVKGCAIGQSMCDSEVWTRAR